MTPQGIPVLVDTDFGTDPDDLLALLTIAGSPELEVVGISTCYGDTRLRAHLVADVCDQLGLSVPIGVGPHEPMSGAPVWYAGNERHHLSNVRPERHVEDAIDLFTHLARTYAGDLRVLALGPLTTIATTIIREPVVCEQIRHLYVMGGDFTDPRAAEHNIASDHVAARAVAAARVRTTYLGVDQSRRLPLRSAHIASLTDGCSTALGDRVRQDLDWWQAFHQEDVIMVHDPLTTLLPALPDYFSTTTGQVEVREEPPGATRQRPTDEASMQQDVVRDMHIDQLRQSVIDRIRRGLGRSEDRS